jgi:sulfite exporter TauE/SafE
MDVAAGLLMGIIGSIHCAAMCGPIALALPPGERTGARFIAGRLLYNGGRIVTYVALGGVLGSLGGLFALAGMQQALSIGAGALMVLAVLAPSLMRRLASRWSPADRLHAWLRERLGRLLRRQSLGSLFAFGLLNGLLPCGLFYAALAAAAALGDPLRGALFTAGFGLGTVPVIFAISTARRTIGAGLRGRLALVLPAFTVLLGVLLILRGLNLGIPYVSPRVAASPADTTESCCH